MNDRKSGNWFGRHKVLTVVGVLVILIIIGVGVSNNSPTVKTTANSTTSASSSSTKSSSTTASSKSSQAHVGATISLKGNDGAGADVTLVKIVDPATGADQYTTPDSGKRFVGVQLNIKNTSTSAEQIAPDNDTTLFDSTGQSYSTDLNSLASCQAFAGGGPNLAPGESALGCETFQIPTGATIAKVEFTPSSGFANDTGEWLVP